MLLLDTVVRSEPPLFRVIDLVLRADYQVLGKGLRPHSPGAN